MQAADASQLFQSDASLERMRTRTEKAIRTAHGAAYGYPIWVGQVPSAVPSKPDAPYRPPAEQVQAARRVAERGVVAKVLGAHLPSTSHSPSLYLAENGRLARGVHLASGRTIERLRGHLAPVTAVASLAAGDGTLFLFTSSWDGHVRVWLPGTEAPVAVMEPVRPTSLKSLHVHAAHPCLLTGAHDGTVCFYDLRVLITWAQADVAARGPCPTPRAMGRMAEHTRPILALTSLPPAPDAPLAAGVPTGFCVFAGDSMGRMLEVHVTIRDAQCDLDVVRELDGHETSVRQMVPLWRSLDGSEAVTAELWTASLDATVRRFPLAEEARTCTAPGRVSQTGPVRGRAPPLKADRVFSLGCEATAVLPLGAVDEALGASVLVGLANGDVAVYDEAQAVCTRVLEGHTGEVTFLGVWERCKEPWVVSGSLDGTVRRWPLRAVLCADGTHASSQAAQETMPAPPALTEEEEAELAWLANE